MVKKWQVAKPIRHPTCTQLVGFEAPIDTLDCLAVDQYPHGRVFYHQLSLLNTLRWGYGARISYVLD